MKKLICGTMGIAITGFLIWDSLDSQARQTDPRYWGAAIGFAVLALVVTRRLALAQGLGDGAEKLHPARWPLIVAAVVVGTFSSEALSGAKFDTLLAGGVGGLITAFLIWSPRLHERSRAG